MPKKYTVIETWIVNEIQPTESGSAEQTYERLEKSPGNLPVIDVPQDLTQEAHFIEEAQVRDFVLSLGEAKKVLDIGCGDGWPLLRIAPFFESVTGIDAAGKRVTTAIANAARLGIKNVTVKQMSATALDFPDASFDGVVAAYAIEQTPDPYTALREVFRVLKPGGKFRIYFEPYEGDERGVTERIFITETEDALGYHYVLKHHRPPWERNYLIKFTPTPEMKERFNRLKDLIDRLGPNPTQAPEIGMQFLQENRTGITGATWYELEHWNSATMKETLEEIGFTDVDIRYSPGTFARKAWPYIQISGLGDAQLRNINKALSDLAVGISAPIGSGEPVIAAKPG